MLITANKFSSSPGNIGLSAKRRCRGTAGRDGPRSKLYCMHWLMLIMIRERHFIKTSSLNFHTTVYFSAIAYQLQASPLTSSLPKLQRPLSHITPTVADWEEAMRTCDLCCRLVSICLWDSLVLDTFTTYAKEKNYLTATIKSYLNSFKHLYHYHRNCKFQGR